MFSTFRRLFSQIFWLARYQDKEPDFGYRRMMIYPFYFGNRCSRNVFLQIVSILCSKNKIANRPGIIPSFNHLKKYILLNVIRDSRIIIPSRRVSNMARPNVIPNFKLRSKLPRGVGNARCNGGTTDGTRKITSISTARGNSRQLALYGLTYNFVIILIACVKLVSLRCTPSQPTLIVIYSLSCYVHNNLPFGLDRPELLTQFILFIKFAIIPINILLNYYFIEFGILEYILD